MDVPPSTRENIYEAWLFDDATGYYHSLGMLSPSTFGPTPQGRLSITTNMVNPYLYDKIVITEESQNNLAPSPSTIIAGGSDIPFLVNRRLTEECYEILFFYILFSDPVGKYLKTPKMISFCLLSS
jgi:hypothetical protein